MRLSFRTLTGADIAAALEDLARLRIDVFRDWPYLYDGDVDYERRYLRGLAESAGAIVVAAYNGAQVVGMSTGARMSDHAEDFAAPFQGTGYRADQIFYCAESVLLPAYRGQGAGHAFFDAREAQGRALSCRYAAFCAVVRPADHPLRPADYRPLDPFWRKRGYRPLAGVIAQFRWKDVDQPGESNHPLQFWIKSL